MATDLNTYVMNTAFLVLSKEVGNWTALAERMEQL